MRVGLLIYGLLETISGGYLYDRKLVEYLRAQGDSVEIVSLPWRTYPRHLLDNFSPNLFDQLKNLSVDVLLQDELNHPSLAWLNDKLKVPYPIISLVHHLRCDEQRPPWQNSLYRAIERRYLNSVDGFIFNSQTTQQSVDRVSRIDHRPWVIATPAGDRFDPQIETAEISARTHQPGPLRLVFLGNLIPRKGLHTLIDALARIEVGCCTLDVVGGFEADPNYAKRIVQTVENSGLEKVVKFHRSLNDVDLANMIRTSQVLVVPSSYEGFGIVYLEGTGFGLPGIGTNLGAAKEIIIPGETGYLINPGDSSKLAAILTTLQNDRNKLTNFSLAARARYQTFPNWEESMEKIRTFLQNLVRKQL